MDSTIVAGTISAIIFEIRGKKVILDRDLALLYGVSTKALNQAVKRNIARFPSDFMFVLSKREFLKLVTICDRFESSKHSTALAHAFTEQGVAMLSSVLNSERAIQVNIQIMRAFTNLRRFFLTNQDLRKRLEAMEQKYDKQFALVFRAMSQLLEEAREPRKIIGFKAE